MLYPEKAIYFVRLMDVVHNDSKLYLVFEFLDLDLKRYMDSVKQQGFTPIHVKVAGSECFVCINDLCLLELFISTNIWDCILPLTSCFA